MLQERRIRALYMQQLDQHEGRHGQNAVGLQHLHQLVGADEAPDAAVQPEQGKHHNADGAPGKDDPAVGMQILRIDGIELEVKAQPKGGEKGDGNAQHIQGGDDDRLLIQAHNEALSFIYHKKSSHFSDLVILDHNGIPYYIINCPPWQESHLGIFREKTFPF